MELNAIPEIKLKAKDLPSKGKFYPRNATVSYRGYTFGEMTKVAGSKGETYEDRVRLILSGVKTSFNPLDLTFNDLLYLGVARKISTLGSNEILVSYQCSNPECNEINEHKFTQASLSFKDLEMGEENIDFVEIELTTGKTYKVKPFTVGNFFDLCPTGKFSKEFHNKELMFHRPAILAAMVTDKPFKEVYTDFSSITNGEDLETLAEIDLMFQHNIQPLKATCPVCDTVTQIELEAKEALFRAYRGRKEAGRSRVRIVSQSKPVSLSNGEHGVFETNESQP